MQQSPIDDAALQSRQIRANDAKQLLQNPLLRGAFSAVGDYLERAALNCDPDNTARAQRIVLSKQLLAQVQLEIERFVEDGDVAAIQMAEIERQSLRDKVVKVLRR